MSSLAVLNDAVQKAPGANAAVKAWIAAATPLIQPPTPPIPPPTNAGGIGLVQYGGTLASCSHLTDGTYATVVGDWPDAALLATVSGEGYAYTVTTVGVGNPSYQPVLDVTGTNVYPGYSLTPAEYVAAVTAQKAKTPGLKGIFLDNTESNLTGLLSALQTVVVPGLHAAGLKLMCNAGWYISGDSDSNDGTLWKTWAAQLDTAGVDRLLLENWQWAASYQNGVVRTSGPNWWQFWDQWQTCVGVAPDKFVGLTYGPLAAAVYGRASMLLAPGSASGSVFVYNNGDGSTPGTDPYNTAWAMSDPTDVTVNSTAGTATL
jgi:hypothetical protein